MSGLPISDIYSGNVTLEIFTIFTLLWIFHQIPLSHCCIYNVKNQSDARKKQHNIRESYTKIHQTPISPDARFTRFSSMLIQHQKGSSATDHTLLKWLVVWNSSLFSQKCVLSLHDYNSAMLHAPLSDVISKEMNSNTFKLQLPVSSRCQHFRCWTCHSNKLF